MYSATQTTDEYTDATVQTLLPELLALSLDARHVQWNVDSASERIRKLTHSLEADARHWADALSQRATELGIEVDVRAITVSGAAGHMPFGRLLESEATAELRVAVTAALATVTDLLQDATVLDPVSADVLTRALVGLENYDKQLNPQAVPPRAARHLDEDPPNVRNRACSQSPA